MTVETSAASSLIAPGVTVVVRDEEWLVTSVDQTSDGQLLHVQGLGALVKGTTASFYESLDHIEVLDPAKSTLTPDSSPGYRRAKLWLEATLRKTSVPLSDDHLVVSTQMLADPLAYQQSAVRKALSPDNLRTRILLADAVGLGKTLEIGMILSELVRRGRGDRILIVCPRHVLEQMQHEMWTRFALPFVRLDSVGVQKVKQKLPATRNPFTFYRRVIISIDTLKQDRFANDLRGHRWDAVVIEESHNVTNSATQNNRLARILAPSTDALILASATPHNGREESFAELIRLLEPTAVTPDGHLREDEVKRLVIRRHRHSPEVANVVGADWAERKEPQNFLVPASPEEDDVADELDRAWLHPQGSSPYSGTITQLFPWTLAKAFLSSPAALRASIRARIARLPEHPNTDQQRELDALHRLDQLNDASYATAGGKYGRLPDSTPTVSMEPSDRWPYPTGFAEEGSPPLSRPCRGSSHTSISSTTWAGASTTKPQYIKNPCAQQSQGHLLTSTPWRIASTHSGALQATYCQIWSSMLTNWLRDGSDAKSHRHTIPARRSLRTASRLCPVPATAR